MVNFAAAGLPPPYVPRDITNNDNNDNNEENDT